MLKITSIIESVRSEAWKNKFLSLISDYEVILSSSKEDNYSVSSSPSPVEQPYVLAQYKREELVAARQHYNNKHLIAFWKWYNKKLEGLIQSGKINREFPVFSVARADVTGTIILKLHDVDYFRNFIYQKSDARAFAYRYSTKTDHGKKISYADNPYVELLGQLHLLSEIVKQSTTIFYKKFLFDQKNSASSCWDDYTIHYFLDRYLYISPDGQICGSSFSAVFFSNNLNELEVYLHRCKANKYEPSLAEISDFLGRQRKHYLSLATTISIEENAFLNNNRNLLYYDRGKEVVVMPKLDNNRYEYFHKELVLKTGVLKMNGCPFAKSKGISGNAVIEVFARFDRLMLKLIECWKIKQQQGTQSEAR